VLRERFAEPSTRTPPASPMNNDGHAAALNRAALMPLLPWASIIDGETSMARSTWRFFFAGRPPPGPVFINLPPSERQAQGMWPARKAAPLCCAHQNAQARAMAAFNPTQHQSPAAGRREAAGGRGREGGGGGARGPGGVARGYMGGAGLCSRVASLFIYYYLFHRVLNISSVRVLNI
jgi:hypothetical protein